MLGKGLTALKREKALLLWMNATIYNGGLIDRMTYEKMDRRIRGSFDKGGKW